MPAEMEEMSGTSCSCQAAFGEGLVLVGMLRIPGKFRIFLFHFKENTENSCPGKAALGGREL